MGGPWLVCLRRTREQAATRPRATPARPCTAPASTCLLSSSVRLLQHARAAGGQRLLLARRHRGLPLLPQLRLQGGHAVLQACRRARLLLQGSQLGLQLALLGLQGVRLLRCEGQSERAKQRASGPNRRHAGLHGSRGPGSRWGQAAHGAAAPLLQPGTARAPRRQRRAPAPARRCGSARCWPPAARHRPPPAPLPAPPAGRRCGRPGPPPRAAPCRPPTAGSPAGAAWRPGLERPAKGRRIPREPGL